MDIPSGTLPTYDLFDRPASWDGKTYLFAKRVLDLLISVLALVFLLPGILAIALMLLLLHGRPVFFVQQRVGRNGTLFRCYKFRTMVADAEARLAAVLQHSPSAREEWNSGQKLVDDPRVHRFGALLRRSSIDEIPQFWNVLLGAMTIVGPRPITEGEQVRYAEHIACYRAMTPGITGLWQVSGRSSVDYHTRVSLDVEYYRTRSMRMDAIILMRTVRVCLLGVGSV